MREDAVLDLTDPDTRSQIRITVDEFVADDWTVCQQLGTEAHALGDQGVRTCSATGVDTVLVVFPELLGGSLTAVELVERWDDLADLAWRRSLVDWRGLLLSSMTRTYS